MHASAPELGHSASASPGEGCAAWLVSVPADNSVKASLYVQTWCVACAHAMVAAHRRWSVSR